MQIKYKVTIFIQLFVVLSGVYAQNWDISILRKTNNVESTKRFSTFISESAVYVELGAPLILGAIALLEQDDVMLKNSLCIGATLAVNGILTYGLKAVINRPRPYETYPAMVEPYRMQITKSFPSGHASFAFALASSVSIKYPKWYIITPSYLWACSVGYSRMNLGVHYPSDVVAGAALGIGSAYFTHCLNSWIWNKLGNKSIFQKDEIWY